MSDAIWLTAVILLGSCVGSFLNVVIYRLPEGTFFSRGSRSRCRHCGAPIRWFDNLPVVSWLFLRGRARCCGKPIGLRYPLVEAMTAGLMVALWMRFVGAAPVSATATQDWMRFAFLAWFLTFLVACTFIDIDHRILPDVLTKPTMVIGCLAAVLVPGLAGGPILVPGKPVPNSLLQALAGLATGFGLTWAVRAAAGKVFGREAMGFGDVKFMAAIGAFVGLDGALITFFLGTLFGAFYGVFHKWITGEAEVFFGPFLAAGAVITLFFKQSVLEFVTETWPAWQASLHPSIMLAVTLVCMVFILVLIRRGRALSRSEHDRRDGS